MRILLLCKELSAKGAVSIHDELEFRGCPGSMSPRNPFQCRNIVVNMEV
jgi:hypothetical protein